MCAEHLSETNYKTTYCLVYSLNFTFSFVTGTCAGMFTSEVQFGHAGSCTNSTKETATAKNEALKAAGAYVPDWFDYLGDVIQNVYEQLVCPYQMFSRKNVGIGGVISLLWFQRCLPPYCCKFFEMCLMVTADHGPAVSGAHNTIVCARAGKDLVSSLVSGLLTIGDRFGGALDGAAKMFSEAYDTGKSFNFNSSYFPACTNS
ncbi:hypothetical protein NQ317_015221 [Molorchus minor]|uniref:Uncharacterized protein n=1 Tax=Molorchus minor TaxID=1323400 RepID=A0ABQ9JEF2_9CUCU|nr:hypothetical protein NQ317_015221 [Molorchus minor]